MRMRIKLPFSIRRLGSDERGTSIVELGLFMPFLLTLIVGIVDVSNGLAMRFMLHKAVHRTLELATTHTQSMEDDESELDFSFLEAEAARAAQIPDEDVEEDVEVSEWLECDGVQQPDFNGSCAEGESIARYVQVRVEKDYSPMFAIGPMGDDVRLFAESAVRIQ